MSAPTTLRESADITDEIVGVAVEIADGFYGDGPIDWESLLDRLEEWTGASMESYDCPAYHALQRRVRAARRDN